MDYEAELKELRDAIDKIDQQLQDTINQRGELAQQVGKIKKLTDNPYFYRPEREAKMLAKIMQRNKGPIKDQDIGNIFRSILSASLALQRPTTVAFLGPAGTFSNAAAIKHFGPSLVEQPVTSIGEVFHQVMIGKANYGIVPIENSTAGFVSDTFDELRDTALSICGETLLPVSQCLLVSSETAQIDCIYSHQQSLAQCHHWLNHHFPKAQRIAVASNAMAAQQAKKTKNAAAIAGSLCAEPYGLTIKQQNIQDNPNNTTRFVTIGKQQVQPSGNDKTSLIIYTANEPKALTQVMQCFSNHNINITMIETRPRQKQMWSYTFYMDIEGHQQDPNIQQALSTLSQTPSSYEILGSYPKAQC